MAITHHPWYQHHRASDACSCLAEAAALGLGHIRSDVRWKDVIPDTNTPDEDAFRWYRSYFTAARDWYGLQPLIVLSEAPRAFGRLNEEARMNAWKLYVEQVIFRLGDLCQIYQVFNEPNNPVYRFFRRSEQAAALTLASNAIKSRLPHAQLALNLLLDLPNWKQTLIQLLADSGDAVDIISVDSYPGTWSLGVGPGWSGAIELASEIRHAAPGSVWTGRKLAIMETGYTTNIGRFRTQKQQADYFASLQEVTHSLDSALGQRGLELLGLYEICDDDSSVFLDPEAHFGLLTSTFRRKAGFRAVQHLCSSLAASQVLEPALRQR